MAGEQENLKKLLEIYSGRLKILKEFKDLAGRIAEEIKNKGEEAVDLIDELTEKREALLDKIKDADISARRFISPLGENYKKMLEEIKSAAKKSAAAPAYKQEWAGWLFKNFAESEAVLKSIKETDEKNAADIKALMENMKIKIDSLKANKKMMDRFADDFDGPAVGTLMNEKR
jgi:DNA-binding ferritin-like protein